MSQLGLPLFHDNVGAHPAGMGVQQEKGLTSEDDRPSSEEKALQAQVTNSLHKPRGAAIPPSLAPSSKIWGAGLTWDEALSYTALSPRQLRRWQKSGALRFRRVGRNGVRVVLRRQLDDLMEAVFAAPTDDIGEDFDFG